jgi:hypothetical protein
VKLRKREQPQAVDEPEGAPDPGRSRPRLPRLPRRSRGLIFSGVVGVAVVAALVLGPAALPHAGPPAQQLMAKMSAALKRPTADGVDFSGQLTIGGTTALTKDSFSLSAALSGSISDGKVKIEATIPDGGKVDALLLGQDLYLRPSSSGWMLFPLGQAAQVLTGSGQTSKRPVSLGLGSLLSGLGSTGGQSFEGPEIDGADTYEVRPLLLTADPTNSLLSKADVRVFVGRDDGLPRRLEISVDVDQADVGAAGPAFGMYASTVDVDLDLNFSNWGAPVSIKAPPKAKDQTSQMKAASQDDGSGEEIPSLLGLPW